jgi:hypothetical protein
LLVTAQHATIGNVTVLASAGPATSLPWWMAGAVIVAWVGLVVLTAAVVRSRRVLRIRRPAVLSGGRPDERDDRGLPERVDPIAELGPGPPWP